MSKGSIYVEVHIILQKKVSTLDGVIRGSNGGGIIYQVSRLSE
jgi:hypothetical protein